jgi:hypothetical protein
MTISQTAVLATPASWFDRSAWRLDARRLVALAAVLATAVGLRAEGDEAVRSGGLLLVVEAALICLPWRLPRRHRSGPGFWAETLAGLVAPVGAVAAVVVLRPGWVTAGAEPRWYAVSALTGLALLAVSGLDPRAVASGELAFALGPTPRSHGTARAFTMLVAPAGEEALFRGPVLVPGASTSLALLAATGFVARHHLARGSNRRGTSRATLVEIAGAVVLLGLTVASGSIYPALLAHLVNNLPGVVVELQREAVS